jgi:phosphate:Na+ symporter
MQTGMSNLQGMFGALDLTSDGWLDRIPLVLLGLVFTAVTQSSSAGVAAVLTAMHAEAVSLTEGLALVIGMNIGTTVTAVLATIGGSPASRRTGASHFVYNVLTAVAAFFLVTPYVRLIEDFAPTTLVDDPQLVLVVFHTGFNLLGVMAVLPFTRQFAVLMTHLVPEPSASYARGLVRSSASRSSHWMPSRARSPRSCGRCSGRPAGCSRARPTRVPAT